MADPLIITASDVGAEIAATVTVIDGLDLVFANCPSLSSATQAQWIAYKSSFNSFIDGVNASLFKVPLTNIGVNLSLPFVTMATVRAFQEQLVAWQQIAQLQCGAKGPVIAVPPPGDPAWLTAVKWGGGFFVVGAVIFALAPVIEKAVMSKAAGSLVKGAKASAASTKRLVQRARA